MKRILFLMAGGFLALVLVLTVVYGFRRQLIGPYIEHRLNAELESRYGVRVSIGQVGGTFLTNLKLGEVKTDEASPQGPIPLLSLHQGEVSYWLPDLIGGVGNFLGHMNITLDGLQVELNLDRLSAGKKGREGRPIALPSPADLPGLNIRDSRVTVQGRGLFIDLAGLHADLQSPKAKRIPLRLELQAAAATVDQPWIKKQTGSLSLGLTYGRERLVLDSLRFAGEPLIRKASLGLGDWQQGIFTLQAALLPFGGKANLGLRVAKGVMDAQARLDGIDLGRLSSVLAISKLPSFAGILNGTAALRVAPGDLAETLEGKLDLHLDKGRFRQLAVPSLRLQASARKGEILISHFGSRLGTNQLAIDGIGIPTIVLLKRQWSQLLLAASPGTFSLRLDDIPALLAMAGIRQAALPAQVPKHRLVLTGRVGNRSLSISEGFLRTKTGVVKVRSARFELPRNPSRWSESSVAAGLTIDLPKLAEVGTLFDIAGLRGSLTGDVHVVGTLGALTGQATVAGKGLVFHNTTLGDLQVLARADRRRVQIKTFTLQRDNDFVRGHGTLRLKSRRLQNVTADFSLASLVHYAPLLPPRFQVAGRLTGSLTAEGPLDEPKARLRATLAKGNVAGLAVPAAQLALASHDRTIIIEKTELTTDYGSMTLAGTVDRGPGNRRFDVRLHALSLTSPAGGDLRLVKPAALSYSLAGVLAAKNLVLRGSLGEIRLDGRVGRHTPSALTVRLAHVTGRNGLSQLLGNRFSFSGLDAELTMSGTLDAPALKISGRVATIRLADFPIPVSSAFDLAFGGRGLTIDRLGLTGPNNLELSLTGSLPVNPWRKNMFLPGTISLSGRIDLPSLELLDAFTGKKTGVKGVLKGNLRLTGTWADPEGHLRFHGWDLRVKHPGLPAPLRPLDLTAEMAIRGDELRVQTLRLASQDIDFMASGRWTHAPSLRSILRGGGLRPAGTLDFQGNLKVPEIGWLARGWQPIRQLAGSLQTNLRVSGPARDPLVNGFIRISQGELRTAGALPPIEDLSVTAELAGRRLLLQQARGELGAAPFSLTGSIARNNNTTIFDLALHGKNMLFFRNDWMMVRADSDLTVTGPLQKLAVQGKVTLTNGYYQQNVDFLNILRGSGRPKQAGAGLQLFSIRNSPLRFMTFNVKIGAQSPFRINNNVAKAKVRPDLTLTGTGELPVLLGKVYIDQSTILLPTTRLQVSSGLVRFPENRPNRPSLDLLATTKMSGYDINVQIEGTYSKPIVTLSSVPPLAHDDLLLLLLSGRIPAEAGVGQTAQAGGLNIALYVGKGLLAKWFGGGSGSDEESLLDRLQVQIGQGVTQQGQETLNAQLELTKGLLKKKDILYLTAERDIYDNYNVGVKIVFQFK